MRSASSFLGGRACATRSPYLHELQPKAAEIEEAA